MSYQDLLTDRCAVYHLVENQEAGSFGVPGETAYSYPVLSDLQNVSCLFAKESTKVVKEEPGVEIVQSFRVHFLINTDVRFNDKIVLNGTSYRLEIPRNIRGHHIEVTAIRNDLI
ncbi:DUF3599 family protein [Bacillus sp. 1NLA3E]|uniref:DUF3599 family protein n=1 Tax=Bacillus sp. 1NLA3E TaxID=666686 RepID=UPI000247E650|nr:DUF3599 family protein [Bacillus sp. 1NLA3E]AGK52030.1 hypothetical protein B1NLA3E_01230 [Bacillus sp. 1NLA3E]